MNEYCSGLCNGVNGLLRSRSEEMKRSLGNLEKQHSREFKKLHHNIKRKLELVNKLQKKLKKENAAGSNRDEVDKLSGGVLSSIKFFVRFFPIFSFRVKIRQIVRKKACKIIFLNYLLFLH